MWVRQSRTWKSLKWKSSSPARTKKFTEQIIDMQLMDSTWVAWIKLVDETGFTPTFKASLFVAIIFYALKIHKKFYS